MEHLKWITDTCMSDRDNSPGYEPSLRLDSTRTFRGRIVSITSNGRVYLWRYIVFPISVWGVSTSNYGNNSGYPRVMIGDDYA